MAPGEIMESNSQMLAGMSGMGAVPHRFPIVIDDEEFKSNKRLLSAARKQI